MVFLRIYCMGMCMKFLQNISPTAFTASAVAIGFLLIDDLNVNEQNSVANWFILVGQILETSSGQLQLLSNTSSNTNNTSNNANSTNENINREYYSNSSRDYNIQMMEKIRNAFDTEIENLKK